MSRFDLDDHFKKVKDLIAEINQQVPLTTSYSSIQLRADLAGLLVVAMAATYETCVKDIIYNHAQCRHSDFGRFAQKNYERLNSKIKVDDLQKYCDYLSPTAGSKFKTTIKNRKKLILDRTGKNIETSYHQILSWRHDFAHAWNRNVTIEEAQEHHVYAKRIIYAFDKALS